MYSSKSMLMRQIGGNCHIVLSPFQGVGITELGPRREEEAKRQPLETELHTSRKTGFSCSEKVL